MNEPKFLKDLKEKRDAAQKEMSEGRRAWEQAQEAVKKFPELALTGERRTPRRGDIFFAHDEGGLKLSVSIGDRVPNESGTLRFILRKVEPPPEPAPKVDREEAIRKAKEAAAYARINGGCLNTPATLVVLAVEAIPDPEPSPRVVWACPGEVLELLEQTKSFLFLEEVSASTQRLNEVISLCRSTREATVEEVEKVKNQPPDLTAGEFNRE